MGYVPRGDAEGEAAAGGAALLAAESPGEWRTAAVPAGACALVADDDPGLRELVADRLRLAGWAVVEAEDGAAAVRLAAACGPGLLLVVTDVEMPGQDGREVVAEVRTTHPAVAAVIMSGRDRVELEARRPLPDGVVFLPKPFSAAGLLRAVEAALAGS